MTANVVALAGSARESSVNRKLLAVAARAARDAGAEVQIINLRAYAMPIYDGDLEAAEGVPEAADRLYRVMVDADALLLASPEYNSSITPLLKNVIDWVSRPREGDPPLAAFTGKVVGLLAASPGALGGLRGLVHVRSIFSNIGAIVIPEQVAVSRAHEAFGEDGGLKDGELAKKVDNLAVRLVRVAERLRAT